MIQHGLLSTLAFILISIACTPQAGAQKFYQCETGEKPQIKVWAADTKAEADLWVYFVYDESELGPEGVVLQVPTIHEADFTLSFVDDKAQADFSLWLVDTKKEAGWRNRSKAQILEKVLKKK